MPLDPTLDVSVHIDETGRRDPLLPFHCAIGGGPGEFSDGGHFSVPDPDIGAIPRVSRPVDHTNVADQQVEISGRANGGAQKHDEKMSEHGCFRWR
jgi:hypothetical protein